MESLELNVAGPQLANLKEYLENPNFKKASF